jgi:hypothetical protein
VYIRVAYLAASRLLQDIIVMRTSAVKKVAALVLGWFWVAAWLTAIFIFR